MTPSGMSIECRIWPRAELRERQLYLLLLSLLAELITGEARDELQNRCKHYRTAQTQIAPLRQLDLTPFPQVCGDSCGAGRGRAAGGAGPRRAGAAARGGGPL